MTQRFRDAYAEKATVYFQSPRRDIVDDLPSGRPLNVFEVGCGAGATGALAKATRRVARYVGVEAHPKAAEEARLVLDEVLEGDVETLDVPFPPGSFDVLILSEVLEHLFDPWSVLRKLAPLLSMGGLLYASSPNVAHISILRMLACNRWDYEQSGAMDWTHVRWFTPATFKEMIEGAGFRTIWLKPVADMTGKQRMVNAFTLGRFAHVFISQIFVKAERSQSSVAS